jgi:hypothetical protein
MSVFKRGHHPLLLRSRALVACLCAFLLLGSTIASSHEKVDADAASGIATRLCTTLRSWTQSAT